MTHELESLLKEEISTTIGVVGLGYVGLPVAVAFAKKHHVIGFDIGDSKIKSLQSFIDPSGEVSTAHLKSAAIEFTSNEQRLHECNYIIVAVPTPITSSKKPNLSFLKQATSNIAKNMSPGTVVIFESTVYPGTTEEVCMPILEKHSQLEAGKDFLVGYSPERINPGDQEHTFEKTTKIVSGQNEHTLKKVDHLYQSVISATIHQAPTIKVAEAAKIVENTQRDINIALMNELAYVFDKLKIDTHEVLRAANTKWNFHPYTPGLVGGHCIGIDPYYLIYQANEAGYDPSFIVAGREVNDQMPAYIVQSLLQLLITHKLEIQNVNISVLGLSFKEDIGDIRNSKSIEMIESLLQLGLSVQACDPYVKPAMLKDTTINLKEIGELEKADIIIYAVPHQAFSTQSERSLRSLLKNDNSIIMDIKNALPQHSLHQDTIIWKL